MKRLILSAVLGAAALGLSSGPVQAGCGPFGCGNLYGPFSWLPCRKCCGCGATFCVRQYNAFSPVCAGTVYCDGINPLGGCGIPGGFNPNHGAMPYPCGPTCGGEG